MKKLFLVDAYALIFKYYYAFMGRPMRNRAGMNTSVVFGFTKFLRDIQKREHPDLLGVAFDPKGGSFRREIFPEYKANRAETPEDILLSVPYVKRIVEAMCIPVLEVPGYEADDVIGTLAYKGVEAGYDVFMVTPDKDYGQLVCDNCKIYKQKGNDGIEIVGREAIREKYGIENPQLVRDILALWGDASDNIPGVPGIGPKSARRIWRARKQAALGLDELKRMGVVLKRAQYFITCRGFAGAHPGRGSAGRERITRALIDPNVFSGGVEQLSMFSPPAVDRLVEQGVPPRTAQKMVREEAVQCLARAL